MSLIDKPQDELIACARSSDDEPMLFAPEDLPLDWADEWQGMPEFKMGNTEPIQKITVSFETEEQVREFGELIGQKITTQTDSLWFRRQNGYVAPKNYRWVDES